MAEPTAPPPAHHPLTRAVARALRRRCGIEARAHLLVAVSGGADSVALLGALASLADRRRWRLTLSVAHVQHGLRGDAAEGDARFVEALARELGLDFRRVDLEPTAEPGNIEAWARRQRYAALTRMADACGAGYLVTAHHGDDQLETLLMRMLRGTSVRGLRGIAWRHRRPSATVIRPMLGVTRAEVLEFLRACGQPWREDHTNADVTRTRARLRAEVLPVLHALRGDATQQAVRLADHARDVQRLVRVEVRRQYERWVSETKTDGSRSLPRDEARAMPRVVLTGLMRAVLRDAGVPADRLKGRTLGPIVRAVRDRHGGQRRFDLAGGVYVSVQREVVEARRA